MLQNIMSVAAPRSASPARPRPVADHVERCCDIAQGVVAIASKGAPDPFAECRPARAAAFDRQLAMYLAHVGFGLSMVEVGKAFGRHRTTVVHACHLIEDQRDDCRFDDVLDQLEQAAIALRAADSPKARLRRIG